MAQLIFKVLQCNYNFFFSIYFCQNMLKDEISIISIHKILSTINFKTFSGSFSRYCNEFVRRFNCDLRDIDGVTYFCLFLNPSKKKFRVFEWDLRAIDGATHLQDMAMNF